jgi:hypothetical protein
MGILSNRMLQPIQPARRAVGASEADGMDDVGGAGDPDGAVGFQDALGGGEPAAVEFMVGVRAAGFVPIAFVDGDHLAGVTGDAAVGEEVGRVGEDEVDGGGGDGGEDVEAIAVVEAEVVGGVVEGGRGPFAALRVKESVLHRLRAKKQVNQIGIIGQG